MLLFQTRDQNFIFMKKLVLHVPISETFRDILYSSASAQYDYKLTTPKL